MIVRFITKSFESRSRLVYFVLLLFVATGSIFAQSKTGITSPWEEDCTWTADNGNGTFTNPLFYEEFSDPDMIRVGDDYCLSGTTMHTMPGLPVLHSRDLVNWTLLSYAEDRLDLGPEFRLEAPPRLPSAATMTSAGHS